MAASNAGNAGPRSLAGLMQVDETASWNASELGPILEHQLDVPLDLDLGSAVADVRRRLDASDEPAAAEIRTFRQLLLHSRPPLDLLNLVKQFAKRCRGQPDGPLPHEVATVLYLATIAAARLKRHERISLLDDAAWQQALDWALAQPWLKSDLRELLRQARDQR